MGGYYTAYDGIDLYVFSSLSQHMQSPSRSKSFPLSADYRIPNAKATPTHGKSWPIRVNAENRDPLLTNQCHTLEMRKET